MAGRNTRHDFCLHWRDSDKPALTGEIKMPDSPAGRRPLMPALVDDAQTKAFHEGVRYCFTWNVREFVLFDSQIENRPSHQRIAERTIVVEGPLTSDDVEREWTKKTITDFWTKFLEDFNESLEGRKPFDPLPIDQSFIVWLEGFLEDPIIHTEDTLLAEWQNNTGVKDKLDDWMLTQGWELSSQPTQARQNIERASRLSCYILVTRLVFYQVLRRRFIQMSPLSTEGVDTAEQLLDVLNARFGEAVRYSKDYETIFDPDKEDFGYRIPFLSPEAPKDWSRLVQHIEEFDFSTLDFEVIGQMYERLISPPERRRFGQFYTSPDVVDLINSFCIRNPDDRVLDPSCGGGTFLVKAYYRKHALKDITKDSHETHEELLNEIFGVDIGAFPAQLSTINLAVRHLSDQGNYPRVARGSFFDAQANNPLYNIPLTGEAVRSIALGELDAVVGNPPYIRQENIPSADKPSYAELFRQEWPGQKPMSGRSDLYVYFFTHAASMLKPGGYLGFVTSNSWMDTNYGFGLQNFFLRNFRIVAVMESQVEKWFEDARVTTAVTILQREPDQQKRDENIVRFIQLRKPLAEVFPEVLTEALNLPLINEAEANPQGEVDAVRDLIEATNAPATTSYWRVRVKKQRDLWEAGLKPDEEETEEYEVIELDESGITNIETKQYEGSKWGQHIRGPNSWFELLDRANQMMAPLQDLARIRRGYTTGNDQFYCVLDVTQEQLAKTGRPEEFKDRWGISPEDTRLVRIIQDGSHGEHLIERRFLEPELHTPQEVHRPIVRKKDVKHMVVNASVPRSRISQTHFANYVAYAESQGWHTGDTITARARSRPWYDLALTHRKDRADIFWPKAQQYRHIVPLNVDKIVCKDRFYGIWTKEEVDSKLLWAILNSTIVALSKLQFGRGAGIEGNLDTQVMDTNAMLVPDVRQATSETAKRAITACNRMSSRNAQRYLHDEFGLEDRQELDDATLEILGIQNREERTALRDRIYQDLADLQKATRERETIAQKDRRRSAKRTSAPTPLEIAEEIWRDDQSTFDLRQFPEDFVKDLNEGERFNLPSGQVEVGEALFDTDGLLKRGTIRVGGPTGQVIDVGTAQQGLFLQAMSLCHRWGQIKLPDNEACVNAVQDFNKYRDQIEKLCSQLTQRRIQAEHRQKTVTAALMRKALQWRNNRPQ